MELATFETLPHLAHSQSQPLVEIWDFDWTRNLGLQSLTHANWTVLTKKKTSKDIESHLNHVQITALSDIASLKTRLSHPRKDRSTRIM